MEEYKGNMVSCNLETDENIVVKMIQSVVLSNNIHLEKDKLYILPKVIALGLYNKGVLYFVEKIN